MCSVMTGRHGDQHRDLKASTTRSTDHRDLKLKAEFPNGPLSALRPPVRQCAPQVETLSKAVVVPTSAVQRGPAGTLAMS